MSRPHYEVESFSPDDGLPEGLEYRKQKSKNERCKRKRARSIRKGIDSYFERKNLREELGDSYDDDDFDDVKDDDSWYQ